MTKQMSKKGQRLYALLLAVVMMVSVMPMNAIAITSTSANEGGYIEIRTIEDLYNISNDLTANYILMNDIDLTEATAEGGDWDFNSSGWNPIGSNDIYGDGEFSGIFEGNGYSITGMRIYVSKLPSGVGSSLYLGLFSKVSGTVCNLTLTGSIYSKQNIGVYAGGICGETTTSAYIEGINSDVSINVGYNSGAQKDGAVYSGGVVGYNAGIIQRSSNSADVMAIGMSATYAGAYGSNANYGAGAFAGGISGYSSGKQKYCYNTGNVTIDKTGNNKYHTSYAGGIIGYGASTETEIVACYNTGEVKSLYLYSSSDNYFARGIVGGGSCSVIQTYNMGTVDDHAIGNVSSTNCYYLTGTGKSNTGATALTESQMKIQSMYKGFDFEEVWMLNPNAIYPYPQLKSNIQDGRELIEAVVYSLPKTTYDKWDEFDISGCSLRFTFANSPTEFVTVTEDMVSGYDMSVVGTQTVTITHPLKVFTFEIEILEKPFNEIYTVADLYNIRNDLSANYILMNDIDLTEATAKGGDYDFNGNGWNPIGSNDTYASNEFIGVFDGNGHTISGMRIDITKSTTMINAGLFANVSGTIKNLKIDKSSINLNLSGTGAYIGGVAAKSSGTITTCASNIEINANISRNGSYPTCYCGGIVGYNAGSIIECYTEGKIVSKGAYDCHVGGISGYVSGDSLIKNCYNAAEITSAGSNYSEACGIVGHNAGSNSTVQTSYNIGKCGGAIGSSAVVSDCYYLMNSGSGRTGATPLTEAQLKDQSFLVGFDFEEVWISDPYAEYPYPQLRSNPKNLEKKVEEIIWVSEPTDKEYYIGEKINLAGAKVEVVYASGLFEEIEVTENMITGFDSSTVGTKTVTVSKGGNSLTFEIEVKEYPTVTSLVLVSVPDKTEFVKDRPVDYTGAVVRATYEGGATADIDVTAAIVTGIDNSTYGTQTATVTVGGKTVTFDIKIIAYRLVGISVEKLPYKTTYIKDDVFNSAGLKVVADYNDGSTKVLQPYQYELTGYSNKVGTQTITVTYYGFNDTFEITVVEKQLANIEITKLPNVLDYIQGQELDMSGAVVVATYNNGTTEVITDYNISGFTGEIGINNVVIASGGVSTTFIVTVREKIVTNISITSLPTKYGYNAGETLDTTGLVVKAFYNDDSEQEITDYSLVGFSTTPGTHVITVSYAGFTDSFEIFMNEKVLSDFQITTTPSKLTYYLGENLDLSDMVATAYYNNGENYAVTDYEISGFDSQTPGTKVVTIAYGDISRDFAVTVKERVAVVTGGEIKVGSSVARLGDNIIIPVSITKNTGLAGFTHTIAFDHTRLEYKGVTLGEYYAKGTLIVNTDNVAEGEITVLWFDVKDIAASNVAYNIEFVVLETAADGNAEINIAFNENDNGNLEGNNVIFNAAGGNVEVRSYWLGDLNGDREYHMVDLLQLAQYVSGKGMTLTEKQLLSADVNEDTIIDIHDVIMLQQWIIAAGVPEA